MSAPSLYAEQEALLAQLRAQLVEAEQQRDLYRQQREYYRVQAEQASLLEIRVGELDAECVFYQTQNAALMDECDALKEKVHNAEAALERK